MPSRIVEIGPRFLNRQGQAVTPMAIESTCEVCGSRDAPFGLGALRYCGWQDGRPQCIGRGTPLAPVDVDQN